MADMVDSGKGKCRGNEAGNANESTPHPGTKAQENSSAQEEMRKIDRERRAAGLPLIDGGNAVVSVQAVMASAQPMRVQGLIMISSGTRRKQSPRKGQIG